MKAGGRVALTFVLTQHSYPPITPRTPFGVHPLAPSLFLPLCRGEERDRGLSPFFHAGPVLALHESGVEGGGGAGGER